MIYKIARDATKLVTLAMRLIQKNYVSERESIAKAGEPRKENTMNTEQIKKAIEVLEETYPSKKEIITGEYPHAAEAYDTALSAFREQEAREKGCEYCDFSSGNVGAIIKNSGDGFILIQSKDGVSIATDDSHFKMLKIAYCPMCGRKLVKE